MSNEWRNAFLCLLCMVVVIVGLTIQRQTKEEKTPVQQIDEFCASVNSKTYQVRQYTLLAKGWCDNGSDILIEL